MLFQLHFCLHCFTFFRVTVFSTRMGESWIRLDLGAFHSGFHFSDFHLSSSTMSSWTKKMTRSWWTWCGTPWLTFTPRRMTSWPSNLTWSKNSGELPACLCQDVKREERSYAENSAFFCAEIWIYYDWMHKTAQKVAQIYIFFNFANFQKFSLVTSNHRKHFEII